MPGPFDSWLTLRGIRTLAVRMDRHCDSAMAVAEPAGRHPAVTQVLYPGLPSHPGHAVAARQMSGFGGMVSFRVRGGEEAAVAVCGRTRLFTLAESLGGVESLIEHPGRMTHASAAGSPLEVPADLVRLSVGLEDRGDLLGDLSEALLLARGGDPPEPPACAPRPRGGTSPTHRPLTGPDGPVRWAGNERLAVTRVRCPPMSTGRSPGLTAGIAGPVTSASP